MTDRAETEVVSRADFPSSAELVARLVAPETDALGSTILRQQLHLLATGLEQLPPRRREVLVLKYVEGLTAGEIARRFGTSSGAIRVLAFRAVEQLRDVLETLLNGDGIEARPQ